MNESLNKIESASDVHDDLFYKFTTVTYEVIDSTPPRPRVAVDMVASVVVNGGIFSNPERLKSLAAFATG